MIDKEDFKGMCDRVARATGRIDEETRAVYLEALQGYPRNVIARAMKRVTRDHGFYKFPTIAEIMDAIRDCQQGPSKVVPAWCETCGGTGFVIANMKGYDTAFRCSCENGGRVNQRIRPFSAVEQLYQPPPDEGRLPLTSIAELEELDPHITFFGGVAVGKVCSECWKPFTFEHFRRVTAKELLAIHKARPAVCHDCFVETGKKKGLWT